MRIPDTLAVIGIDDVPLGRLTRPSLTTVAFDLGETTKLDARTVIEGHPITMETGTRVVVREST